MLGEQIGEDKGKITGRRVIAVENAAPRMETSFEAGGKLLGVAGRTFGTYWSELRADGSLYGEGQGITMGEDGTTATWKGTGVGVFQKNGAINFRGAIYYQSASPKWSRLNNVAVVYEHDVDADGITHGKVFEWK
jgi:hypothetical protein